MIPATYLRKLYNESALIDYTIVSAKRQTEGRGQMGTKWDSEHSKNLTISVFKDMSTTFIEHPFYVSLITSLALIRTLQSFSIRKLSVKWPNDILSEDKKVCGILIENVIKQNNLKASIIGIGLNVNQTAFGNLPKASSLKILSGNHYNLEEVLYTTIKFLKYYFMLIRKEEYEVIKREYESYLFRKNKPSTFIDSNGNMFTGIIKSISDSGSLQVLLEDDILKEFELKEITLLY